MTGTDDQTVRAPDASDETPKTDVVPDMCRTQAGPELAWSDEQDAIPFPDTTAVTLTREKHWPWPLTVAIAAGILAAGALIDFGVGYSHQTPTTASAPADIEASSPCPGTTYTKDDVPCKTCHAPEKWPQDWNCQVADPAPTTTTIIPPVTTVAAPSAQNLDAQFLALTRLDGTYDNVMNYGGAGHARLLCERLEAGETHIYGTDNTKPTVFDIVDVFCPDFDPRGAAAVAANLARAAG